MWSFLLVLVNAGFILFYLINLFEVTVILGQNTVQNNPNSPNDNPNSPNAIKYSTGCILAVGDLHGLGFC
jgi:hypothetical protein